MDISSMGPTRPNEDNIHQEKVMHVLYTNVDCLHNKLSELILLIESLKHKHHIIGVHTTIPTPTILTPAIPTPAIPTIGVWVKGTYLGAGVGVGYG